MNAKQVDYLNIALMVFALILAINLPFKLFLFSYAILGPLHYLTEIGWLKKHNYFTKQKSDYILLTLLCVIVTLGVLYAEFFKWPNLAWISEGIKNSVLEPVGHVLRKGQPSFVFIAFVAALAVTIFNKWKYRLVMIGAAVILSILVYKVPTYIIIFGIFMPTMLHVSLFTGAFILYGAMKSKSKTGYLSFVVFVLCCLAFFVLKIDTTGLQISDYVKESFLKSNFQHVGVAMAKLISSSPEASRFSFDSSLLVRIQAFVAFAYTYHYLNWFSKTSIIKWHEVPVKWIVASAVIWLGSISLYIYDYRVGLIALFFLSMLHVFLEFPLNHRTFMYIGKEVLGKNEKPALNKVLDSNQIKKKRRFKKLSTVQKRKIPKSICLWRFYLMSIFIFDRENSTKK